jgi:hypothetical protein
MTRQYLHMKELIEFGFAHNGKKPGDGELAWFCATCPQPDINYKWKKPDDPRHWGRDTWCVRTSSMSTWQTRQNSQQYYVVSPGSVAADNGPRKTNAISTRP